ncbi:MAG: carboxypeptidase regulatory-like domain-containing protein [Myxococcota bacterium]|nr:carboxypeptidase regulatory-like domain-containing protein [Myxococcota bacterium]
MRTAARVTVGIGCFAAGVIGVVANLAGTQGGSGPPGPSATAPPRGERVAVVLPTCGDATTSGTPADNPQARSAAQRGLDFLGREATAWTKQHNCYGCHVQAVTLEAMAVGSHHQYRIDDGQLASVLRGMVDVTGGARTAGGLHHGSASIGATGKLLGGAAFARYDQWVKHDLRDYMMTEATAILAMQESSGRVAMPWTSAPIATDETQATAQAIITWKQAYERSADDRWLTAIQRGEQALRRTIATWSQTPPSPQALSYAALGLVAAGVGAGEDVLVTLRQRILAGQGTDGGWTLGAGGTEAFATGQALYTLRLLGMTDQDDAIARGTKWLIDHQAQDGGWSRAGFGKAEAMWAVLGLVSIDVLTVAVDGIKDGQRVTGSLAINVEARDNHGGGVSRVELHLDDLPVHGACGATTTWTLDASTLATGRHTLDVIARNAKGEVSRRRLDLYAGDVYLAQIGTTWSNGETEVSLRDLEDGAAHAVGFEVLQDGKVIHTEQQAGAQGPLRFGFRGDAGRYEARLTYRDATGAVKQTEQVPFVHDTQEAQRANFTQVQGSLALPDAAPAANAQLELVDDDGNVVARTVSTKAGKYRFKNVEGGKTYKLRLKKEGFEAADLPQAIRAEKGRESTIDMSLKQQR